MNARRLVAGLLLAQGLFALPSLVDVRLAAMGGVGAGLPSGNSFVLNPATVDLQAPMALGTELGFAEGISSDMQDLQGRLWFIRRFPIAPGKGLPDIGAGLSLDYGMANYVGSYPGAQGVLWSEGRLDGALRVKFGPLSVGVGLVGMMSGAGVSVNTELQAPNVNADLNVGAFLGLAYVGPGHLGIGVAVNRIFADATNASSRQLLLGLSYQLQRVALAFDLHAAPDASSPIDLSLGADVTVIRDRLNLRGGVQWLGLSTFEPCLGASFRLGILELAYSFGYNLTTGGIGTHRIGLVLAAR